MIVTTGTLAEERWVSYEAFKGGKAADDLPFTFVTKNRRKCITKIIAIGIRSGRLEMQACLHLLFCLGKISCDCFIEQLRASKPIC